MGFIHALEYDAGVQYHVHRLASWFWVANLPICALVFILAPDLWAKGGLFLTLVYSLYANFATDYGAMSAALAAQHETNAKVDHLHAKLDALHQHLGVADGQQ